MSRFPAPVRTPTGWSHITSRRRAGSRRAGDRLVPVPVVDAGGTGVGEDHAVGADPEDFNGAAFGAHGEARLVRPLKVSRQMNEMPHGGHAVGIHEEQEVEARGRQRGIGRRGYQQAFAAYGAKCDFNETLIRIKGVCCGSPAYYRGPTDARGLRREHVEFLPVDRTRSRRAYRPARPTAIPRLIYFDAQCTGIAVLDGSARVIGV